MLDSVYVDGKTLRCGHTTGTCAAAASKAAALMLISGEKIDFVEISVSAGKVLRLPVEDITLTDDSVKCAIRKDGGDDIDVTHGTLVYSTVTKRTDGRILVDGGKGVGRVTRKGLDQPVGNAAINRVPRHMILEAMNDVAESFGHTGGLDALIEVPEGEELAKRTFNPDLGIIGGISILGTSGIVMPMSEKALVDTIRTEMRMLVSEGHRNLLLVPGNYGRDYSEKLEGIGQDAVVKCSNFLGETLDCAMELEVDGVLLVGNIGKLGKVAGGIMNTHSRYADCRAEIMTAYTIMAGGDADTAKEIMNTVTTEAALDILASKGLMTKVTDIIAERVEYHMNHRVNGSMKVGAIIFSSNHGMLSKSPGADEMLRRLSE